MNEEKNRMVLYERAAVTTIPDAINLRAIATDLLNSGLYSNIKGPTQAIAIIAAGQELGLGPTASLQYIAIVNGRMCAEAKVWLALFHKSGGKTKIIKRDKESCQIEFSKPGRETYISEYTQEMAKTEGLWDKANWKKMPETYLQWRAASNGIRSYDPGVVMGIALTTEEAEDYPYTIQAEVVKEKPAKDPNAGKGNEAPTPKRGPGRPKAEKPTPEASPAPEKPAEEPKQAFNKAKEGPSQPAPDGFEPPAEEEDISGMAESAETSSEEEGFIQTIKAALKEKEIDERLFKGWLIDYQTKMKPPRVFLVRLGKAIRWHGGKLEDLKYISGSMIGAISLYRSPHYNPAMIPKEE
jgi:hypothetical protein